jgi:hypothetical protein
MEARGLITRTAKITLERGGYIKIKMLCGALVDTEDALDNLLVIKNLSEGRKTLKLVDIRGKWSITPEAKKVSKKNFTSENTIARAYIVDSYLTKVLLSFFQSFSNQEIPEEFFNHEDEAIAWLLSRQNHEQNKTIKNP